MSKLRFFAGSMLVLALAACNATPPGATAGPGGHLDSTIANTDWVLSTLGDTPLISGTEVTLLFTFTKAAGFGGCNQYNAAYTSDGVSTLTFAPIAATRMACAGGAGTFESAYFAALGLVRRYVIEGASLTLSGENGAKLATYAAAAPQSVQGPWLATAVNNGSGAVSSVPAGVTAAFSFLPDGQIEGYGGCNNFSGQYAVDGDSIQIGPLAATMMACSDEIDAFESQFITALQNSSTWSVSGGMLDLRDGDDAQQVQAASAIGR